ncbi:MAG: SLC13 family permease [Deltaproteobacteria bacterium]|nr:SLC13 family permease [Deltaproteobacteria bacterium]
MSSLWLLFAKTANVTAQRCSDDIMTASIIIVLCILLAAAILFVSEIISPDLVALLIVFALLVSGVLTVQEALSGFGSETWIFIFSLFIVTRALISTGAVKYLTIKLFDGIAGKSERLLPTVVITAGALSSFISNTLAASILLPVVLTAARKMKRDASNFLLPMAFASILASSVTVISSSTNVVVSGIMHKHGMERLNMFELAPVGIPILIIGIAYLLIFGRRLLALGREKRPGPDDEIENLFISEIVIVPEGAYAGKRLDEIKFPERYDLSVVSLNYSDRTRILPHASTVLKGGERILVHGSREALLHIKDVQGLELKEDLRPLSSETMPESFTLVEAVVPHGCRWIGRTLRQLRLRDLYNVQIMAINRAMSDHVGKLSDVPLRAGDVLLLQGSRENIKLLHELGRVVVLSEVERAGLQTHLAPIACSIFALSVLIGAFNVLPLSVAILGGALLCVATGCVSLDSAYREIDWNVLILIGGILPLGLAMEKSGAGAYIANSLLSSFADPSPLLVLSLVFFLCVLLTQIMSNQAAAVVLLPIALELAASLNLSPRPFAIMVAAAASCSYITPLEPACLLVYRPGNYRVFDYIKVGLPLTVVTYVIAIILIPFWWPL